jgi:hypothetical protein
MGPLLIALMTMELLDAICSDAELAALFNRKLFVYRSQF